MDTMSKQNKTYTLYGRVVLPCGVADAGQVSVKDGVIVYAGERNGAPRFDAEAFDLGDSYIAPGFVDIHCHAGGVVWAYEDPVKMAMYHLERGTTSVLCTLYRDFSHSELLCHINKIKSAMPACRTIKGVHLEGPYLNPSYGASAIDECERVEESRYCEIADTNVIKQWTYAPEVEGIERFSEYIVSRGIVPAIGHSCAAPRQVYDAVRRGAKIVTHLFCATGTTPEGKSYEGTIDVSFDMACLLCDGIYYEIICDRGGVHVRGDLVKLAAKTVGTDRLIAVTDACIGDDTDSASDINVVNGELYGSKLTMDSAARNLLALGFSVPEVFRMTSTNPAKAIKLERVGSLTKGFDADILVLDGGLNIKNIITSYDARL